MRGIRPLVLVLALVSGAILGSCYLETTPMEECFDVAEETWMDEFEVITLYFDVGSHEECPREGAREVKEAAQKKADNCLYSQGAKLKYIACGPREDRADYDGHCDYVAVYDKWIGQCATF